MWLVVFFGAAFLIAMTPGANNLLGMHHAIRHGALRALTGLSGRLVAMALMIAAVAAGLGPLLASSELALTIIKWAGVAYLVYLGVRILVNTWRHGPGELGPLADEDAVKSLFPLVRKEFLVCAGNPKAVLIMTAFLPQFVESARGPVALQVALLGLVYLVAELAAGTVFVLVGGIIRSVRMSVRAQRNVDRGTGLALLGVAGMLAASR
ncbi:threonine/homoserine/homoserine lactone efflux protein [Herbihabitans rhizosphaerae]|uniref:Threonine/homoserine/homoserine lactone efflux protein n=1 Tax=Herbihabitans rhizosphaerae TaxID=1872711 RepID=A0A4V2ESD2_9PSEU|nr:LysE family translocator [Herbihabitans rhizosphaerae]RZS37163.1 threonine/homoserine/homoserine lactone efflux protein [Herbihabitans rhizosphaerae]